MQSRNFTLFSIFCMSAKFKFLYYLTTMVVGILFLVEVGSAKEHGTHDAHKRHSTSSLNVMLHTEPQTVQAGTPTTLTFHLTDAKGEPVTDLMVHHARVLHVLVVSENLQIIGHIHPEDFESRDIMMELEGMYTVHFTFPAAGKYILAVDVITADAEFAEYLYVAVAGEEKLTDTVQDFRREKVVFGYTDEGGDRYTKAVSLTDGEGASTYQAKMEAPDRIKAGEMVHITYHFSQDGKPLTDLVPFLDAPMHFAIVSTRLDGIVHTHGTVPGSEDTGKMMRKDPHTGHKMKKAPTIGHQHQGSTPEKFGPTVMLMTTFPEAGVYQIFGQLKHGDQILWPSFMVEVTE
ncbi:hypothetical protein F4Z99_09825 [Candidatus Poribacteria bacterium]|nr:hypothetical protein [Candidatus Poribacteria bacterium]MYA98604.1 hypothetical protein [Candidatus Poribacteria bacterium]